MAEITDYLNGLNEQNVQEESKILVVENPVLDKVFKKYESFLKNGLKHSSSYKLVSTESVHDSLCKKLRGICCSAQDIRNFSFGIKNYESSEVFAASGLFLSVLINKSFEEDFEIVTAHLNKLINCVGYKNEKNVVVNGDLGESAGVRQIGGSLRVKGSVDGSVGSRMTGGKIIVNKDITGLVGYELQGGKIYVKGNTSQCVGLDSKGGKIYFSGKMEDNLELRKCNARIYQNGVRIWPK